MDNAAIIRQLQSTAELAGVDLAELAELAADAANGNDEADGERQSSGAPTVAEFYDRACDLTTGETCRTYSSYWRRLVEEYGDKRVDQVKVNDVRALVIKVKEEVVAKYEQRRARRAKQGKPTKKRTGRGAQESFISAARRFFKLAADDGWFDQDDNPASEVDKPKRRPIDKPRSLSADRLYELWAVVRGGGNDPELDSLLVRFHLETAARRGGALSLRVEDLNRKTLTVTLHEKDDGVRQQPVSRDLMDALAAHAHERGAIEDENGTLMLPRDAKVFHYRRYADGSPHPLTKRRYETLYKRIRVALPWAQEEWLRVHDLRHTTLTAVERLFGHAVAKGYAGHEGKTTTDGYTVASSDEIRNAHRRLVEGPDTHEDDDE